MLPNEDMLLKPKMVYAFFKALPLIFLSVTFLFLAWRLSYYFILFSLTTCGAAWYRLLYIRSYRYLITTEYIRLTKGIFFKRTDQIELFRVKDYVITQSPIQLVFKMMNLTMLSTDPENNVIVLMGIPASDLTDIVRDRVLQARKINPVYEIN